MQNEPETSGAASRISAELSELQALHDLLMRAYGRISQGTKRLSPARPYLLAHVRLGSERLCMAYTTAAQSEERSDVHKWLNEKSDDLEKFIDQLDSSSHSLGHLFGLAKTGWSAASTGYAFVMSVLTPTAAAATLSAVVITTIHACLCEVFVWSFRVLALSLLVIGMVGFWTNRRTLLKWTPNGQEEEDTTEEARLNVYETEQKLLRKVNAPRHGEIQWDVITWFLLAATFAAIRYIAPIISRYSENAVIYLVDPGYFAVACVALGIIVLLGSRRRPWGWRPVI